MKKFDPDHRHDCSKNDPEHCKNCLYYEECPGLEVVLRKTGD